MKQQSRATLEARRDALLKKLAEVGPFVQGSFCTRKITCGKPGCRCADGEKHEAYVLTNKVRGKTVTTHVPRDLVDEVQSWAKQYKRVKELMKEISDLNERIIRIHVKASRAAARNRDLAQQTQQKSSRTSSGTTSRGS